MNDEKDLIKLDDAKSIAEFLQQPATKIAEFITGVLISDTKDWKFSAGRIVQASIKWKLFSQLGKEIKEYIEKGKIKKDFLDKPQNHQSLYDLLRFIDESTPDKDRFNAIKTLFFRIVVSDVSEAEQILSYQFMQLCKDLESGDLLILKAAYDVSKGTISDKITSGIGAFNKDSTDAEYWLKAIANQIGHSLKSLVEVHEEKLESLKLISTRRHTDRSGIEKTPYFRLTDFGYKLCEFIYSTNI